MSSLTGSRGPTGGNSQGGSSGEIIPKGYTKTRLKNYTPEQMQLFQEMFSQVSPDSYTSKLANGDQSTFEETEAPAWRQFQQAQGDISSRFSGMGLGGRHGSGFQNQITQAGADFAQDLQSKRQAMRMNAIKELMGMSGDLLNQKPYENGLQQKPQKEKSGWGGLIGAGVGGLAGFATGGPVGALGGARVGYGVGSKF